VTSPAIAIRSVPPVWAPLGAGVAVFVTVLCLYLVGDGLRDALDPRLKSR